MKTENERKSQIISTWEANYYTINPSIRKRMIDQLSESQITAKLDDMSLWADLGGVVVVGAQS